MDKKKLGIIVAAMIVLIASAGGFVYSSKKADAKEATAKQALIASIGKQQDLEEDAKQAKADAPVVSEEYPARIIPPTTQDAPKPTVTPSATDTATNQATSKPASTTVIVPEIPQQSPTPPQVAPKVVTPAPAQQDAVQPITTLAEADIQRLQSYKLDSTGELFVGFKDMYTNERAECDAVLNKFSPKTLSAYYKAKVEWLTSPGLVYINPLGNYCVRGILSLTYYSDNAFGLTSNVTYQREVEYSLNNSVTNGSVTLKMESINYLSGFKAVK